MSEEREARRLKARADERRRQEELDKVLDEPKLPAFEAPATASIVENPPREKKP